MRKTAQIANIAAMLLFSLSIANSNAGQVYRWVDKSGNTVISDRPPADTSDFEVVSTETGRTLPNIADPEPVEAKEEPPKPTASKPSSTYEVFAPEKDERLCAQAKQNLNILEVGPRIRFTDDSGTVRFMTDAEREVEKDKTRDAISAYCDN